MGISGAGGGIVNNGTISASATGIHLYKTSTFQGGITNTGTILAPVGHVLEVGTGVSTFLGGIVNTGVMSGFQGVSVQAVAAMSFQGGITNTGTIEGNIGLELDFTPPISVFDSGEIATTNTTAIQFQTTGGPNTLTLGPGYDIPEKCSAAAMTRCSLAAAAAAASI